VRDWWFSADEKSVSRGKVAWKGENEVTKKKSGFQRPPAGIRLYLSTWEKPPPDEENLAAEGGHLDVVKRLVRAGAKKDAKTTAIPGGSAPGAGGSPDEPPRKSDPIPARTALQIAEDQKHADVVAFLKAAK
jgi:hypothetical protein